MCLYAVRQSWDHNGSATGCIAMATIPKVTLLHIWRITSDLAHFSPETDGAQWWSHFTRPGIEWCCPSARFQYLTHFLQIVFGCKVLKTKWCWGLKLYQYGFMFWNLFKEDKPLWNTNMVSLWARLQYLQIFRLFQSSLKLL